MMFSKVILFFCQEGIGKIHSVAEDRKAGEIAEDPGLQTASYSIWVMDVPPGYQLQAQ